MRAVVKCGLYVILFVRLFDRCFCAEFIRPHHMQAPSLTDSLTKTHEAESSNNSNCAMHLKSCGDVISAHLSTSVNQEIQC